MKTTAMHGSGGNTRLSPHKTEVISLYGKAVTADFIVPDRSEMTVGATNSFLLKCALPVSALRSPHTSVTFNYHENQLFLTAMKSASNRHARD
jgi:hypothetical protein